MTWLAPLIVCVAVWCLGFWAGWTERGQRERRKRIRQWEDDWWAVATAPGKWLDD